MRGGSSRSKGGFRGAWALRKSDVSPYSGKADQFYRCPGVGRSGGKMGALYNPGGGGRGRGKRVDELASGVVCRGPFPLESPARYRCLCRHHALGFSLLARGLFAVARLTHLDGTVAMEESICTRRFRVRLSRARVIPSENHFWEYWVVYICCT